MENLLRVESEFAFLEEMQFAAKSMLASSAEKDRRTAEKKLKKAAGLLNAMKGRYLSFSVFSKKKTGGFSRFSYFLTNLFLTEEAEKIRRQDMAQATVFLNAVAAAQAEKNVKKHCVQHWVSVRREGWTEISAHSSGERLYFERSAEIEREYAFCLCGTVVLTEKEYEELGF